MVWWALRTPFPFSTSLLGALGVYKHLMRGQYKAPTGSFGGWLGGPTQAGTASHPLCRLRIYRFPETGDLGLSVDEMVACGAAHYIKRTRPLPWAGCPGRGQRSSGLCDPSPPSAGTGAPAARGTVAHQTGAPPYRSPPTEAPGLQAPLAGEPQKRRLSRLPVYLVSQGPRHACCLHLQD